MTAKRCTNRKSAWRLVRPMLRQVRRWGWAWPAAAARWPPAELGRCTDTAYVCVRLNRLVQDVVADSETTGVACTLWVVSSYDVRCTAERIRIGPSDLFVFLLGLLISLFLVALFLDQMIRDSSRPTSICSGISYNCGVVTYPHH